MKMINDTFPQICDPCLVEPFQLYPVLLVLPAFLSLPVQCLYLCTKASEPLTEKTDVLTLAVVFVDFLHSVSTVVAAFTLRFLPMLYGYMWSTMASLLCMGHPLFQNLVCLERYFAVEHPVAFLKFRPLRYRFGVLAAVLGVCVVSNSALTIICVSYQSFLKVFLKVGCVLQVSIVAVNSFTCLSILRTLRQPSPSDANLKSQKSRKDGNSVKRKAFHLISWVQINIILCYTPPILFFLLNGAVLCSVYVYNLWYIEILSGLHCVMLLQKMNQFKKIYNAVLGVFESKR